MLLKVQAGTKGGERIKKPNKILSKIEIWFEDKQNGCAVIDVYCVYCNRPVPGAKEPQWDRLIPIVLESPGTRLFITSLGK